MSAEKNYAYNNRWKLSRSIESSPERVMEVFQSAPSQVFPFPIKYPDETPRKIELGRRYDLRAALFRSEPVEVDSVTPTSFRFLSLPGHWHGSNATIEFTVERDGKGRLVLQQHAEFPSKWYTPAADIGSKVVWFAQAKRLSYRMKQVERPTRT